MNSEVHCPVDSVPRRMWRISPELKYSRWWSGGKDGVRIPPKGKRQGHVDKGFKLKQGTRNRIYPLEKASLSTPLCDGGIPSSAATAINLSNQQG